MDVKIIQTDYPTIPGASFRGTIADFDRLFAATICTNKVRDLTRKFKKEKGCQFNNYGLHGKCSDGYLQAAHRHGYDRPQIVKYILYKIVKNSSWIMKPFKSFSLGKMIMKELKLIWIDL